MNIFYDGIVFNTQRYGGVSRYFVELVDRIANRDDLNLFLFRFPSLFEKRKNITLKKCIRIPKINRILREIDTIQLPWLVRNFDSDIYHTTYYRIPENIKVPKVVTVYDMIHEKFSASMKGVDRFLQRKRRCIERADKIIAISESTKRDILEYIDIPEEKIAVTYLAASALFKEATENEKSELRRKYNLGKPFILYVGRRSGYKNFVTLLRGYSKWSKKREFDLVCIGGASDFSDDEIRIIKNANLVNSVKLFTGIGDDELRIFYSSSHVFVCPSLYEGFGIPPLEAMACGTPVIVSKVYSLPEVVGDAGLYFNPSSTEELLACLNQIADDVELRKQLIGKGLNRIRLFSWEKTATKTLNIYDV